MAGKGFKTASLEESVLNDLQRLTRELSVQEDRRITLSDTVRMLLQTYDAMNTPIPVNNGTVPCE